MHRLFLSSIALGALTTAAVAAEPALRVTVEGIDAAGAIAEDYALCVATKDGKSEKTGKNLTPAIAWSGAPKETKSFAVFVIDPDVPADLSRLNKDGIAITEDEKRQDFYHYGVINLPATYAELTETNAVHGKKLPNDLGHHRYVTPADAFGGPCPPWNDARVHHYHFVVMALDVPSLALPENATVKDALAATKGRIIAQGEKIGTYTLNPKLRGKEIAGAIGKLAQAPTPPQGGS